MERLTDIAQYQSIVERYKRPGCLTNDYLQARAEGLIADGLLMAECDGDNAWLLECKPACWRLYYYLNDLTAAVPAITPDRRPVMVEILYRGAEHFPEAEHKYLLAQGFVDNLVRDQYAAVYKDLTRHGAAPADVKVRLAAGLDEE